MKHRNSEEHRIEQRLRRIETQLQDILMARLLPVGKMESSCGRGE